MKTYQVVNALDGAGLETRLNRLADEGYELQSLVALPNTSLLAVVRKASAVPVTIGPTTPTTPAQRAAKCESIKQQQQQKK